MVDEGLILRKLTELETYLEQIQEYGEVSPETYRADWKTQRIVERTLQLMIELCVDIGNHIISEKELPVPVSYASTFEILEKAGLISGDLARTMVQMSKFRNILVHQYTEIDEAIVVDILHNRREDFTLFRDEITAFLKQEQD